MPDGYKRRRRRYSRGIKDPARTRYYAAHRQRRFAKRLGFTTKLGA